MLKVIMILAAVFGMIWTIRIRKAFPATVTLTMVLGIIIVFFNTRIGLYVHMGATALAIVYSLTAKIGSMKARLLIFMMSLSILGYWLWVNMHWHGNAVVAPIVTLVVAAIALFKKVNLKNELGFLIILVLDAVAILIENYLKAYG